MVSRSRMPPPSCTGISSPTALTTAFTASSFLGLPAKAPFRSTRCRRRAPSFSQWRAPVEAVATGKGILTGYKGLGARGGNRPFLAGRAAGSVPGDEIRQQAQAGRLAFFRVELHGENVIPRNGAGKAERITGGTRHQRLFLLIHVVAVHKIEAAAIRNTRPHLVGHGLIHLVPAHVRHLELLAALAYHAFGGEATDFPRQYAQTLDATLFARLKQHLQADAQTQKRLATRRLQ